MVSKRPTTKQAKEHAKGILPVSASPEATPIMLDSAMPRLKARSGWVLANFTVMVDFERSASSVTMRGSRAPSSRSASPNAAREALAAIDPPLFLLEPAQLVHEGAGGGVGLQILRPRGFTDAEDFPDGGDRFLGLRRFSMPLGIVLHERHALALHRVRDDQRRRAVRGFRLIERLADLREIVAVDLLHGPAKRLPLG